VSQYTEEPIPDNERRLVLKKVTVADLSASLGETASGRLNPVTVSLPCGVDDDATDSCPTATSCPTHCAAC
jgi:hypothetical protein